jgi:dTDP-4-dehydrorhamnose reductase
VVAVTGAGGRLGRALVIALGGAGYRVVEWSRPNFDLDRTGATRSLLAQDSPALVIHAAAWTDVDGCARDPALAQRRNADATRELAAACFAADSRLVLISTNEVFDGQRSDGAGYSEEDSPRPINPYGASKLAGEQAAAEEASRAGRSHDLVVIRTAWLFGPPGNDFPAKIVAAADRLPAGEPLKVVEDEIGSPTYSVDLAEAIVALLGAEPEGGVYHLVNEGRASRLDVARRVLDECRPRRSTTPISRSGFVRDSDAPAWAVLTNRRAAALGVTLRRWDFAVDDYARSLCA